MSGFVNFMRDWWRGWPQDAKQEEVLSFIAQLSKQLATIAEDYKTTPILYRHAGHEHNPTRL
jgi:hypothetical protein